MAMNIVVSFCGVQMDKATKSVQTNNQKLAGVLKRVRSTRNFCIDITLIIILLAVIGYIYTLLN
jgi:syntaxin of plants SYP7